MYLKRLELHGFKSFASPTALEFGSGVTCVAGPNGAGKTNVAEAVRWVLGEHAGRVIRARKTEDIIFSGSAKRSALGLAEVRITLDNSDHWLPLEFDEVVVARRAYRSGENEYYINQGRVRLKDVQELFLKAQVGQNSYAFMGQGLVEQVLTLRPEERRGLIEEAADVRLHRDRLDEARNRLAATRENLERAQLLVREIEPRLRQLERQADRAATYNTLAAELAQALHDLYGQQWQDARDALAAARAACDQRREAFEAAQRAVAACEEGVTALAGAIEERRAEIAARDEAHRQLREYLRDLQHRVTLDEERDAMLSARREELLGEIASSQREREQLAGMVGQLTERADIVAEQLGVARAPEIELRELEELDRRLAEARRALDQAESQAARAQAELAEAQGRADALAAQLERRQQEVASLAQARAEPLALLKAWAREFATRRRRALELGPAAQRAAREFADATARLQEATAAESARRVELEKLAIELQAAETRLEVTRGMEAELPAPDAAVRALMAAAGLIPGEEPPPDSRIQGVAGMVGQIMRVPAGLERAIEAALAESLYAVVVERQEDALAAVELLVSEDLGRGTVYPLGDIRETHPINLLEERGVVGVASELVRCEPRYRKLINTLLGRTIVVQNLGVGKAVLRRGLGNVVTLDGILLHQSGALTAGSARPVRAALIQQREAVELPADLERLRAARGEAQAGLEEAERELAEARQASAALEPEAGRLAGELSAAEDALRQHRARLAPTAARLVALRIHGAETKRSLAETAPALGDAREEAQRAAATAQELLATRTRQRAEVDELRAQREALAASIANRSDRIDVLEKEQQTLAQQLDVQTAALERIEHELGRREALQTRLDEDLRTVRGRLEAARRELETKTAEATTAAQELAPARNELEQLESRQRSINDDLAAARSHALTAERGLLDAEAQLHLREEELEALHQRLAEEGFRVTPDGELVSLDSPETAPSWLTTSGSESPPPMRGGAPIDTVTLRERIGTLRNQIRRLGPVNEQAESDYAENKERYDFLTSQLSDLGQAEASLLGAIDELERIIKERFSSTFQRVNQEFQRYFTTLFNGGHAELVLTKAADEDGLPGVDIAAQPPRKKVRTLAMLSGGERTLTAIALLFALLQTHPSPICVLDEVDAALDESNVDRFCAILRELAERTQFIIITHNRRTLEMADTIYGVSMGEDSTSTLLSLRLGEMAKN